MGPQAYFGKNLDKRLRQAQTRNGGSGADRHITATVTFDFDHLSFTYDLLKVIKLFKSYISLEKQTILI